MANSFKQRKLMLIGGGGHCHSLIDSVIAMNIFDDIGIVDSNSAGFEGVPVIGADEDIPELISSGWNEAFISVGSIGNTTVRRRLYDLIKRHGLTVPVIADPSAIVARDVEIKEGCFIGKNAVVNSGSVIGTGSIINTGVIVEHDCTIGEFVHVSSGSTLCGQVQIGDDSHIGAGSVVCQLISIGAYSLIGAGSVVVKDIPNNVKAYGNPCRVIDK